MQTGVDAAVCGTCPLRSWRDRQKVSRLCYVNPLPIGTIYRTLHRGAYPRVTPARAAQQHGALLRLGAGGDPAAVPAEVIRELVGGFGGPHVGYTHAWRERPDLRNVLMASCFSLRERDEANTLGWRAFLVMADISKRPRGVGLCPASKEGGYRKSCAQCRLCCGGDGPDIVTQIHGRANNTREPFFRALEISNAAHPA